MVLTDRANAALDEASNAVSGVYLTAGEYAEVDPGANTCTNAWCHDASNSGKTATWNTTNTRCDFCHGDTAAPPATGSHSVHIATSTQALGGAVACTSCHENHGANYAHLNGTKLVQVRVSGTVTVKATPTALNGCGTNDCHNDGAFAAPAAYTWGTTIGTVNSCTDCHGDASTLATYAHNNHVSYATSMLGVTGAAICAECHTGATAATHANATVTIKGGLSYSGNVVVGVAGYGSCSTGSCHNVPTNIVWNVTANDCGQCHSNTADRNDFALAGDRAASMVSSTEYSASGHGKADGGTKACLDCHDLAVAHTSGTANFFRLKDLGGAAGVQFTCSDNVGGCHLAGLATNNRRSSPTARSRRTRRPRS